MSIKVNPTDSLHSPLIFDLCCEKEWKKLNNETT